MKKFFQKVVPLLLALLIIASVLWYCFVYDRSFTRDVLLQQARYHSTHSNAKVGSWFYDLAYRFSSQDENVAIELANQFKSVGNYSKAEYTLSSAIADGGTVELYIALCKTYVEEDKLLDAVNMLDSISDSQIKAKLDALRPAAPTSDPAPGFYSEYISVSLNGGEGTLYYTLGEEYPSTDDIPYSDPFTLSGGETVVRAVTVADNGLVSPLSVMSFTVGGVIEEVSFTDAAIDAAVRESLSMDADKQLFTNDLWNIHTFTVPEDAMNLQELSKLPYLESLTVSNHTFDSLRFMASLTSLRELTLTECRFPSEDMEYIASLPALSSLTLSDCGISTIAGLELAQNLTYLDLSDNTVRNLEPLSSIHGLQTLILNHNALTSLTALSTLTDLQTLDVSYNALTSIAPIATCKKLSTLNVGNNDLTSLGAIDNLPELTNLTADHNSISDVSVLSSCAGLVELDLANNALTDISALGALSMLEILDFSRNEVAILPSWPADSALRSIDGSYNQVESLSSLSNLLSLTHVYMDYNNIASVKPLVKCYNLVTVNVYGNEIEEGVEELTDQEVIVNYDPT